MAIVDEWLKERVQLAVLGSNTGSMWASRPHSYRDQLLKQAFH
jgi:hypothetical protein